MVYFSFCDYTREFLTNVVVETEEKWKKRMKDMHDIYTADIIESFTFFLPLNRPVVRKFSGVNFGGSNGKVRHEFSIFHCKSKMDRTFYLSFEKDKDGITVQYADEKDEVKDNLNHQLRGEKKNLKEVEKNHFDFTKPLVKLMGLKNQTVENIVENWKTALEYSLLKSNCQDLVNDLREIFKEMSKKDAVCLRFPGSNKNVSLSLDNEKEIIKLFNSYSKECKMKQRNKTHLRLPFRSEKSRLKMQDLNDKIPRVIDFEYDSKIRYEDGESLDEKKMKGKIDEWIEGYLDENKKDGMYFTHLNENNLKMKLLENNQLADLDKVWFIEIDGVILSKEYGVIIIDIVPNSDQKKDGGETETDEEIFIKGLFNTFYPHQVFVKYIRIQVNNNGLERPCQIINKRCMEIDGGYKNEDELRQEFCKVFKILLKDTGKKKHPDKQIEFLAGLLLILQNVVNVDAKLFNIIINQNWATGCKYIVWSMQQREIIDAMRIAFKKDPKDPKHNNESDKEFLCKLIVGCPGSGKTLILLHAIEEYCKEWKERNALFIVPKRNTCLSKQVTSCLEKWGGLDKKRVEIRSELPSIDELTNLNVGFIAIDEFYEEEFLKESPTSISMHRALELGIHIWIATMDFNYELIEDFTLYKIKKSNYYDRAYELGGANYRSNKAIIQLVHKVQESQKEKDTITVDKDHSSFMPVSGDAVKLLYMSGKYMFLESLKSIKSIKGDTTEKRSSFIDACVKYILQNRSLLEKGKVLIYNICHYSLFLSIKREVEVGLLKEDKNIKENLVFGDTRSCQGAQYAYSIGIYDHSSVPYEPYSAIITALTRTVLSAHLLINITTQFQNKSIQSQYPSLVYVKIDGTSELKVKLLSLRNRETERTLNREHFTVLYSEGDNSIDVAQIREIDNIRKKKVPYFPFKKDAKFESWNDVDVVVGSPKFYANYQHAWSPIHSCDATFVVTCREEENKQTVDDNNEPRINYGEKIRDLLVNKFNQND